MPPTPVTHALDVGFIPEVSEAPLSIVDLQRSLREIQRLVLLSAAASLGRDTLTPGQERDLQLIVLDAHHSNLWLILGVVAHSALDAVAKSVGEIAVQPLLDRLHRLLGKPAAQSPIDAVTLRGLLRLTESAARGGMQIQLEASGVRFSATPLDYQRLQPLTIGYFGDLIELHGVVSELSFKRNMLTLDVASRNLAIECRFTGEQALAIRDVIRVGYPLALRGRGCWGGAQISANRPDFVQIDALVDPDGHLLVLESPRTIIE